MRTPWALLVAALFLPFAMPAVGQPAPEAAAATHVLDDSTGDVMVNANGQTTGANGRWAAADLKGVDVAETQDDLTFILTAASLSTQPEAPMVEGIVVYRIDFTHNDRLFQVVMVRQNAGQTNFYTAMLQAYDNGRDAYASITKQSVATADESKGTISATFSKDTLVDEEGNAPQPQVPFTQWHASAQNLGTAFFGQNGQGCLGPAGCQALPNVQATDAMPDQGFGPSDLKIRFGIVQTGNARLSSPVPNRASNGEATTILYQVVGHNVGKTSDMFMLGASGAPAGWDVQLPAEHVTIAANDSVNLPILVTIPFTHLHGSYQFFVLTMTSMKDAGSVGRIQLGVRFSNPPQPTQHHPTVWVHSDDQGGFLDTLPNGATVQDATFGTGAKLYMNALEDDDKDSHLDVAGNPCNMRGGTPPVPPMESYCWDVPLSPSLELGLDFDMNKTGKISIPIATKGPMQASVLRGSLEYYPPVNNTGGNRGGGLRGGQGNFQQPKQLAEIDPKAPVDVSANGQVALEADLKPILADPYIPFVKGASLVLHLQVDFTGVNAVFFPNQVTPPFVQAGGLITDLPLLEYHDRVNQLFASSSELMLSAAGAQDRMANPGSDVLFNLTLMNHGKKATTVDLVMRGTHAEWSTVLVPTKTQVQLPADGSTKVSIVVHVPKTAKGGSAGSGSMAGMNMGGDAADLVLSVTSTTDLNQRALARLHVMADTSKAWPDDHDTVLAIQGLNAKKSTPGLELPLLLAALALVLLAQRRRMA